MIINSRIINVFKKKISLLRSQIKKAGQRSGLYLKRLKGKWKKEHYSFKIFYNEIDVCQLQQQNEEIRGQKRKLENLGIDEQAKRLKVEQKREEVLKKGEKTKKFYLKKFRVLARKVSYLQKGKGGPEKKKKFTDYSQRTNCQTPRERTTAECEHND